jgi:hypothetical protein
MTYAVLRDWLRMVSEHLQEPAEPLLERAAAIDSGLHEFLLREGFAERWGQLCRTHEKKERRVRAFHEWFDGLKSLRCIHALGERYPAAAAVEQVPRLFELWGWPVCSDLEEALVQLRRWDLPWLDEGDVAFLLD